MSYESLNYMDFDSLLTEEELMVRNTVREFADSEIIPKLQKCHREESFPASLIPRFAELGLLGSTIKGYDCPGLGNVAYGLLMQSLERADSGVRSFCSVQGALVMYPIFQYGSEEQNKSICPNLPKPNSLDVSDSRSRMRAPIRGECSQQPWKQTGVTNSTAIRCGSPTAAFPILLLSGPD